VIRNVNPAWFVRPNGYDASRTIHGVGHTSRVLVHALDLSDALDLSTWERDALGFAALWHDIGRTNDGVDYYHGAKSAGKAVALGLHVNVLWQRGARGEGRAPRGLLVAWCRGGHVRAGFG